MHANSGVQFTESGEMFAACKDKDAQNSEKLRPGKRQIYQNDVSKDVDFTFDRLIPDTGNIYYATLKSRADALYQDPSSHGLVIHGTSTTQEQYMFRIALYDRVRAELTMSRAWTHLYQDCLSEECSVCVANACDSQAVRMCNACQERFQKRHISFSAKNECEIQRVTKNGAFPTAKNTSVCSIEMKNLRSTVVKLYPIIKETLALGTKDAQGIYSMPGMNQIGGPYPPPVNQSMFEPSDSQTSQVPVNFFASPYIPTVEILEQNIGDLRGKVMFDARKLVAMNIKHPVSEFKDLPAVAVDQYVSVYRKFFEKYQEWTNDKLDAIIAAISVNPNETFAGLFCKEISNESAESDQEFCATVQKSGGKSLRLSPYKWDPKRPKDLNQQYVKLEEAFIDVFLKYFRKGQVKRYYDILSKNPVMGYLTESIVENPDPGQLDAALKFGIDKILAATEESINIVNTKKFSIDPREYSSSAERLVYSYNGLCKAAFNILKRQELTDTQNSMIELGLGVGACVLLPGVQFFCSQLLGGAFLGYTAVREVQRQSREFNLSNAGVIEMVHMTELTKVEPELQEILIATAFFGGGMKMAATELKSLVKASKAVGFNMNMLLDDKFIANLTKNALVTP
jgi:hypothetical protein